MTRPQIRLLLFSVKLIIFSLAIWYVYYRFLRNKDIYFIMQQLKQSLSDANNMMLLALCGALMFVNWGTEARKWHLLIKPIYDIPFKRAVSAVFTGVSISIFTPNRLGSFVGRILYLPNKDKVLGTVATFYGNLAQLCITALFGTLGLLLGIVYFPNDISWIVAYGLLPATLVTTISLGFYFKPKWIARLSSKIPYLKKYEGKIVAFTNIPIKLKWQVLDLSFRRYLIFTLQLLGLLIIFEPEIELGTALSLTLLLWLVITFIPTPFLGKLGVRETVALALFATIADDLSIVAASFLLWVINIAFPAIIGGVLLFLSNISDSND